MNQDISILKMVKKYLILSGQLISNFQIMKALYLLVIQENIIKNRF